MQIKRKQGYSSNTEMLLQVATKFTYTQKTKRRTSRDSIVPDKSAQENSAKDNPIIQIISKLDNIKTATNAGIATVEKSIKDLRRFVRLYITMQTVMLLNAINVKGGRAIRLFAYVVEYMETCIEWNCNTVTFDFETLSKHFGFSSEDTYNKALQDLIKGGLLSYPEGRTRSKTFIVNPKILSCGHITPDGEISAIKQKVRILSDKEIAKSGISLKLLKSLGGCRKTADSAEVLTIYKAKEYAEAVPFIKLFRKDFADCFKRIHTKGAMEIVSFILSQFVEDKGFTTKNSDNISLGKTEVTMKLGWSKSKYYRCVRDLLNSGLIYRDTDTNGSPYKMNPSAWFNGSTLKLYDNRLRTKLERQRDGMKRQKKAYIIDAIARAI